MSDAPETVGQYQIGERIARGPLGHLYSATDVASGRTVAIKLMPSDLARDPESLERFTQEAEQVSQLEHPNIARIIDHGQEGDRVYYVIDYSGETPLGQRLKKRDLSLSEAFTIFKGVALGLEAAHQRDLLHRDLHPANVLVSSDLSTIRVTDFGISSAAEESKKDGTATSMTTKALHYLAPEQVGSDGRADERSDIYSLGVLFYEMLTGRVPIGQFNLPSRIDADIPAELDPVVLKCLERDPSSRYASVASLLRETEKLEDRLRLRLHSELRGIGRSISRPTSHIFKHRRVLMGGLLALGILAAGAVSVRYWMNRPVTTAPEIVAADAVEPRPTESPRVKLDDVVPPEPEGTPDDTDLETAETSPSETSPGESSPPQADGDGSEPAEPTAEPADATAASTASTRDLAAEMLRAAQAKAGDGRADQALVDIERLLATYPGTSAAAEALFLRARIEEAGRRWDDAMDTYTQIGTDHANEAIRAKARYRFGRAALESDLPNRNQLALGVFDEIPRAFPSTEYAPLALASKAGIEEAEKTRFDSREFGRKVPAAFVTSIQIIEDYPDSAAAERAFWTVGAQYEDLKLWDRAADAFWQLATRFPETRLDAWWKAGQIFDRRLDDTTRALEAYRRVPETSAHADDARKRIARLTK